MSSAANVVGTTRNGAVVFTRSALNLGFETIMGVDPLPDGRFAVHGELLAANQTDAMRGSTVVIQSDGTSDPSFTPIPIRTHVPCTPLADGTWARIEGSTYERYAANGSFFDQRPLSTTATASSVLSIGPSGHVYVHQLGLGVLRLDPTNLRVAPDFFLPIQSSADRELVSVLEKPDGSIVAYIGEKPGANGSTQLQLATATASRPQSHSLSIVGQRALFYHPSADATDSVELWRFYETRLTAGTTLRFQADYFGVGNAVAHWEPLDGTQPPTLDQDGVMEIVSFSADYAGRYQLVVTNDAGRALGPIVDLRLSRLPRLTNLSGRARVDAGERTAIAGFSLRPNAARPDGSDDVAMLVRSIGPSLSAFDITSPLPDPTLGLNQTGQGRIGGNDNWSTAAGVDSAGFARLGAFGLEPDSLDSAFTASFASGSYTALTHAKAGQTGVALTELYLDDATVFSSVELVNLSLRGWTGAEDNVLVAGFVIEDPDQRGRPTRVLIRGIGPGLAAFGIESALPDPTLRLFNTNGYELGTNDNWSVSIDAAEIEAAAKSVGAFELAEHSLDASLIVTLPAGAYTAHVGPNTTAEGVALVEIYVVPNV